MAREPSAAFLSGQPAPVPRRESEQTTFRGRLVPTPHSTQACPWSYVQHFER